MTFTAATLLVVLLPSASPAEDAEFFEREVRPILVGTCLRCHGPEKQEGGLRVDSRESLLKGGESGPAMMPSDVDASRLVKAIRYDSDDIKMPPSSKLPDREIAALTEWVRRGAPWPEKLTGGLSGRHWAFQRVKPVPLPDDPAPNPVDKFLNVALNQHGLAPAGRADRIALIRRTTFDLTGLPPTPDDVASFLADDSSDAYGRVVERLLASKQYGERWGRHWLDIVRYADTAGETADFPAPHAWRYRNYVIDSFNADKPYDQFLREQLAGDILGKQLPADASREQYAQMVTATGYLAVARRFGFDISKDQYLTIEDTIDTLGKSVLGLTLACARCHDHKYDPITAADYYGLYGIFDSTLYPFPGCEKEKAPKNMTSLLPPAEFQRRIAELDAEVKRIDDERSVADRHLVELAALPAIASVGGEIPNGGVQEFDAGKVLTIQNADGLQPETTDAGTVLSRLALKAGQMLQLSILPKNGHGADSTLVVLEITELDGQQRVWSVTHDMLAAIPATGAPTDAQSSSRGPWELFDLVPVPTPFTQFVRDAEKTKGLFAWRGAADCPSAFANVNENEIKFITVTLPGKSFAMHPGPQGGVALAWQCPADMTVSVKGRVQDADATGGDGIAWRIDHRPGFVAELLESRQRVIARNEARQRRDTFEQTLDKAYAVMEGDAHDAQLHRRGDPENRGDAIRRHFPASLGGYDVPENSGSGRMALAEWLTSPSNPLTARVMVNRIWQHHFGAGLVRTPNDFGIRGEPPSHPLLLDWLADRFMTDGWSLKKMHRLIMSTDAYQRSSLDEPASTDSTVADDPRRSIDPSNVWLWRFSRRRLSAEELRDSILAVCGDLDPTPGAAHPFPPESAWQFTQHGPFSAVYEHDKRSIYLMTQRIKRHPFIALFDGADANTSTPSRFSTIVPTQALFFLNDPFIHAKSDHMAARLAALPNDDARIDRAFHLMFSRPASADEKSNGLSFVEDYASRLPNGSPDEKNRHAWAAYCRVLMSSNEFLFVD